MRDKNMFSLLLGLNFTLAAAFVVYLFLSSSRHPKVTSTPFAPTQATTQPVAVASAPSASLPLPDVTATNGALAHPAEATSNAVEPAAMAQPKIVAGKTFDWRDVDSDGYRRYVDNLRLAGCPEDKIRYIILADINALISQKRLREAVQHDPQWWRAEPEPNIATLLRDKGLTLDEERRNLIAKWLGEAAAEDAKSEITYWSHVQLTGPVLGGLPQEVHQNVQEICAESMDRYQNIFWSSINSGQPLNQVELANLREFTRSQISKILNPEAVEEFLLRYSHNANKLRQELRGFDPSADEFRKIFRAIDPVDHAMQLEYGGLETLSPQQRERYESRRTEAIRTALTQERYEAFMLTKDPLYRQAQMMAVQYGAPSSAILPLYQMSRANENRRKEIMQNQALSAEQKRQAINDVYLEQQQTVRRIVAESGGSKTANP